MRRARIALIAGGRVDPAARRRGSCCTTVKPTRYIGIVEWFAAAIIVHDAIIAPFVFGVGLVMRKAGRRIPLAVLAIIQAGLVVGAMFTIVLVPEILAQQHAHLFETLLPFDYVRNLGVLWVGTLVATGARGGRVPRVLAAVRGGSSSTRRSERLAASWIRRLRGRCQTGRGRERDDTPDLRLGPIQARWPAAPCATPAVRHRRMLSARSTLPNRQPAG